MNSQDIGPTTETFIPLSVPEIRGNEWAYVKECLDTGWVSSVGAFVNRFEQAIAERIGVDYAIATVNGTAALHIALLVAGVQPDDEVLVSSMTFIASVNAIRYVGAWPVCIDADPDYWQMSPLQVAQFLQQHCVWRDGALYNQNTGRRVRALMPVHILGHPVDGAPLVALAQQYDLLVIEDAAEALGTRYREQPVGSLGDIACLSFNGNKLITTGGGGMLLTNNQAWAERARHLTTQAKGDPIEYIHDEIGYNYRLTNIQAAMGIAQLELLDEYITIKRRITGHYRQAFADLPGITVMPEAPWALSTCWLATVLIDLDLFGMDARGLLRSLANRKIETRPLWQPIHLSAAHRGGSYTMGCPVAEQLWHSALSLPCSVGLHSVEQERVIEAVIAAASHSDDIREQ
jgi:perosamine synthetase